MNTNKLKKFASNSRTLLINEITLNLKYLEVKDINKLPNYYQNWIQIDDISFSVWKKAEQRKSLIERVNEIWEEQVIEEIAYLWFNRFIALRFMEVNNYLSYWTRVVSSDDKNKLEPDLIKNATHLIWLNLDNNIIYGYLDKSDKDSLYKYLIINICNSLHKELPFMFEKISDYSELLFPESLLEQWKFLDLLVNEVDEEDWKEVEILGWLYQYYISDKKDKVFSDMKTKNKKISKQDIPSATQLFTPKWIVKYMVQNSVWKTWLEAHPNKELQSKWEYYIESETVWEVNKNLKPEEITVLDPAMWSWHILVYAFEILFDIYLSAWYSIDEIPKLIIENNLYWLEIDDRAWQIACFAIMMKARKYDKRILKQNIDLNVCSIQETFECANIDELIYPNLAKLCTSFKQWKLLWSLIILKDFDEDLIDKEFKSFQDEWTLFNHRLVNALPLIIKQAKLIYKKYSCVVSNPPYMWGKWMNKELSEFLSKNYPETKSDLFSAFIERNFAFTTNTWFLWFMTPFVWMFISSYQKLREKIIQDKTISTLIQLEYGSFSREVIVPICTFVLRNNKLDIKWDYIKLSDFKWVEIQSVKTLEAIKNPTVNYRYKFNTNNFSSIPWSPIAYWVSEKVREIFEKGEKFINISDSRVWLDTWDNDIFVRFWFEVINEKILFNAEKSSDFINWLKWALHTKWWDFRRYYWNYESILSFDKENYILLSNSWNHLPNKNFYFLEWFNWSRISSWKIAIRFTPKWFIFNSWCPTWFVFDKNNLFYLIWLMNSYLINYFIQLMNPTLNFQSWTIQNLPIIFPKSPQTKDQIDKLTQENIDISKEEWDSRETSWDFTKNELLKHKTDNSLENAYNTYCKYWEEKFFTQHKNEEELNRLFIEIYGLEDEMTPEVELKDITLLKKESKINPPVLSDIPLDKGDLKTRLVFQKEEIVKQFISYAVGCMMWRYSLDNPWLTFAGWDFDKTKYSTFEADTDWIIPVLNDEYFEDDIVAKFREFVKVSFGQDSLNKNLDFIANALVKKWNESSLDRIRRYFIADFYKDHCDRYKKRPIYWMFSSWKDKTFNSLVYLHRYDKDIIWKIRMDYLHKLQWKFEWTRWNIESKLVWSEWKEKLDLEKERNELLKKIDSLKNYDEKLRHLADQRIELDLDDWVKVNYPKLGDLLESVKL